MTPDTHRVEYRLKSLRLLHQQMAVKNFANGYAIAKAAGLRTPAGRIGDARVRNIITGRRATCDLITATAICETLGVTLETLFQITEYLASDTKAA